MNKDEVYKKRIRRLKKMKIMVVSFLLFISIITGFYVINRYYSSLNSITYEDYEIYQYFSGARVAYSGKATIKRNNEITSIESKEKKIDTGFIPIYFQKVDNECLLPETMELVFPSIKNKSYKVNYFTKIMYDYTGDIETSFLVYKDKRILLDNSFLYDGDNLYFFPYSTSILIDGKNYNLSPLSYIIVNYKDMIEMYDKQSDKYTIIDSHNNDVIATMDNYKINLSTDMIMYNNENRLLIKNIDKLSNYNK